MHWGKSKGTPRTIGTLHTEVSNWWKYKSLFKGRIKTRWCHHGASLSKNGLLGKCFHPQGKSQVHTKTTPTISRGDQAASLDSREFGSIICLCHFFSGWKCENQGGLESDVKAVESSWYKRLIQGYVCQGWSLQRWTERPLHEDEGEA